MCIDISKARIFIRPGRTDMRKAVRGLTAIIQEAMGEDAFSGSVYLFCGGGRKMLKAVYWDKTGFWLSQKRLEAERYPWPEDEGAAKEITGEELRMLLQGIDFFHAHKELAYKTVV